MRLLLVILLIVVVVGVIYLYYFRAAIAPWMAARRKRKRKKNIRKKNIRDMLSYIKSTGEFDFIRLMNNAGAPMVLSYRSPGICRLPEKREYLKMVYSRKGETAFLDELYVLMPLSRKKIWEKVEEYYFCFYWISGASVGVKARKLYLTYDAISAIYDEVKRVRK